MRMAAPLLEGLGISIRDPMPANPTNGHQPILLVNGQNFQWQSLLQRVSSGPALRSGGTTAIHSSQQPSGRGVSRGLPRRQGGL